MEEEKKWCPICDKELPSTFSVRSALPATEGVRWVNPTEPVLVSCPKCGDFYIGIGMFDHEFTVDEKIKLKYLYHTTPASDKVRRFENYIKDEESKKAVLLSINAPKNLLEKIERVLIYAYDHTEYFGGGVILDYDDAVTLFFCRHQEELGNILAISESYEYIHSSPIQTGEKKVGIHMTPLVGLRIIMKAKGIEKVLSLTNNVDSDQCFVAMWFDTETDEAYKFIEAAIRGNPRAEDKNSAEYGAGYKAFKINDKLHANYIPPEIIAEVKQSRFMIADLTGYRGGVYYEAGYAEGMGIPVIYTCKKDWFNDVKDENGNLRNGVHFDLKQKNIILWTDDKLGELQRQLASTIGAIVGFNN